MPILSIADLQAHLSADYLAQFSEASLGAACAAAEGICEGYLGGAYQLPLEVVPAALRTAAIDIANRRLYELDAPDGVQELYRTALKFLQDVADKRVSLRTTADAESPSAGGVLFGSQEPLLSKNALAGW